MLIVGYRTIADHDIGFACCHRCDDRSNVLARILPVSISVDDDVGAFSEAFVDPIAECFGEAAIAAMAHDVVDTPATRDARCVI